MTKKVLPTLTDVDTGEILFSVSNDYKKNYKTFNIGDFGSDSQTGEAYLNRIFMSFIRGVRLGRNLNLSITIKDFEVPKQLDMF